MEKQNWWLADYLKKVGIAPDEFVDAFARIANAGTDQIKTHLWLENKDNEPEKMLSRIKVNPQTRTFKHIEKTLRELRVEENQGDATDVDVREFHRQWQTAMLDQWQPFSEYKSMLIDKITQLSASQFPMHLLEGLANQGDPVPVYADELSRLLMNTEINSARLCEHIERLLRHCQPEHLPFIAELASLFAYHLIPSMLWSQRGDNLITIGSDKTVPALYRQIQNWRSDKLSQLCEFEGMKHGVQGATPVCKNAQRAEDMFSSIVGRVGKRIDDYTSNEIGKDSYTVSSERPSEREMRRLEARLKTGSKSAHSAFLYAVEPDSIDDSLQAMISERLPSLRSYSHKIEEASDIPELDELDGFLNEVGTLIEAKREEFREPDPVLAALHQLIAAELGKIERSDLAGSAPNPVDRVKYLKWFNEVLKAEKYVSDVFDAHPVIKSKILELTDSAKGLSIEAFDKLSQLFS